MKMLTKRGLFAILFPMTSFLVVWAVTGGYALADKQESSRFYLVGVGPGDPDLITLRAIKAIEQADVVLCSRRYGDKFAEYLDGKEIHYGFWRLFVYYGQDCAELTGEARERCKEIDGKRDKFTGLIRDAVEQGKTVAILDAGDPTIHGPYAWCLEEFEDLDPVVVPGVSCFNAANAALKRGITTSDDTKSVILSAADWPGKTDTIEKLSKHQSTMVLFTMRTEFSEFIEKLSVHYPPETPLAVVKHAGYADKEEVVRSTVGTVLGEVRQEELPFEYLIYVGDSLDHRYKELKTQSCQSTSR